MDAYIEKTLAVKGEVLEAIEWLGANGLDNPDHIGAGSHDFLHLFAYLVNSYMWLLMVRSAEARQGDDPFYGNKLITARYFFDRTLSISSSHLATVKAGAADVMALAAEAF